MDMKVTYIYHSGFCIEFSKAVYIFDYYKGELPDFPEFPNEKQIYVFSSHKHHDHFTMEIFKKLEKYTNVIYIFSNDIKLNEKYLERNGVKQEIREKMIFLKANTAVQIGPITIETLKSTDEGVAFLVNDGERTVYHAGDLHWWHWEGESEAFNLAMEREYKRAVDKIAGREIDVAFLPLDSRQGESDWWGIDYFMKATNTKVVFPMHMWDQYSLVKKLKNREEAAEYKRHIVEVEYDGQSWEL